MTVPSIFRLSAILVRACAAFGRRACQVRAAWGFVSCFVAMTLGFALLTHNAQAEYPEESIWIGNFAPNDFFIGCRYMHFENKSVISFPGKEITLTVTGGTRACRDWMDASGGDASGGCPPLWDRGGIRTCGDWMNARAAVIRNETEKRCLNEDKRCDGRWDPSNECLAAQKQLRLITKIKGKEKGVSERDIVRQHSFCPPYVGHRECILNIRKKIRSCESDIKRLAPPLLVAALSVQADFEAQYEARKEEERRKQEAERKQQEAERREQAAEQERRRKQQEAERKQREAEDEARKEAERREQAAEQERRRKQQEVERKQREAEDEARKEAERRERAAEQERRRKQQEAERKEQEAKRKEQEAKDEYKDALQSASDDSEALAAYEKCVENEIFYSFKGVACGSLYLWPENRRRLYACLGRKDKLACVHELEVREARCESLRQSAYDPRWHERLSYWWDATAWFRAKYLYEQECGE